MQKLVNQLFLIIRNKGITYNEIAEKTGLYSQAISRSLRNNSDMRVSSLVKIADAVGYEIVLIKKDENISK